MDRLDSGRFNFSPFDEAVADRIHWRNSSANISPSSRDSIGRLEPDVEPLLDDYGEFLSSSIDLADIGAKDLALLREPYIDYRPPTSRSVGRLSIPTMGTESFQLEDYAEHGTRYEDAHPEPFPQVHIPSPLPIPSQNRMPSLGTATSSSSPFFSRSSPAPDITEPRPTKRLCRYDHTSVELHDENSEFQRNYPFASPVEPQVRAAQVTECPIVQGIRLVPILCLSDRLRHVFPYKLFNAIQSKCFHHVYESDDNFVMSAPTGSGKTVILELAICRMFTNNPSQGLKTVYMAPTKSLCSERVKDWGEKFRPLNLTCTELTGDTAVTESIAKVHQADVVVTTPEKWDSMTRKWREHRQMMSSVRLLLLDEIHFLGDTRGPILEVIVSRMKSITKNIRFVALSATVPNIADIAGWLGKSQNLPSEPANLEEFGEEFRPVRLERHIFGMKERGNGYHVDTACTKHLPEILNRHAKGQPILIFCFTKKSCQHTAEFLAQQRRHDRRASGWWRKPREPLHSDSADLAALFAEGIAVHHGGMKALERAAVETGFLHGHVSVICSTSTLAVGINLPCHLVIVKNTLGFGEDGPREYSDLEVMQMLGRAGRPQYQSAGAVAVIMTQTAKAERYKRLVSGQELVESRLHLNLIEHMNAEIGLGTITDLESARAWLKGTYLFVRLCRNPAQYKLRSSQKIDSPEERIASICKRDVSALLKTQLIRDVHDGSLRSTPLGDAMARYYVRFSTMKKFLSLDRGSGLSEILAVLAQADEFNNISLRQTEINMYSRYAHASDIRFKLDEVSTSWQKIFVIIQMELEDVGPPMDRSGNRPNGQYLQDRTTIFNSIHRLIRCIIDCQIYFEDALNVRHSLELARSFSSRMWDGCPSQLRLLPGIGPVIARKLAGSGIGNIEELSKTDPAKVGMLIGKPSDAERFYHESRKFPLPVVSITQCGENETDAERPKVMLRINVDFLNRRIPDCFNQKAIYVCIIVERSDAHLVDFRRVKVSKAREPILLEAALTSPSQTIACHAMCEELVGTFRSAVLVPELSPGAFTRSLAGTDGASILTASTRPTDALQAKTKPWNGAERELRTSGNTDEFAFEEINEADLIGAESSVGFRTIDELEMDEGTPETGSRTLTANANAEVGTKPQRRPDGKYECRHHCKDKEKCRHLCCREGVHRARQPRLSKRKAADQRGRAPQQAIPRGTKNIATTQGMKKAQPKYTGFLSKTQSHRLAAASTSQEATRQHVLGRHASQHRRISDTETADFQSRQPSRPDEHESDSPLRSIDDLL